MPSADQELLESRRGTILSYDNFDVSNKSAAAALSIWASEIEDEYLAELPQHLL
jgi:hypothetical protein